MKVMNRSSAVLLVLTVLSAESAGSWWVLVLCAGAASLAALFVSSSRLGYFRAYAAEGCGAAARSCAPSTVPTHDVTGAERCRARRGALRSVQA